MKRIALRTSAAIASLALLAVGSPLAAQTARTTTSGYLVGWSKTAPATAGAQGERTVASGYLVGWSKSATERTVASGYLVGWGKATEE